MFQLVQWAQWPAGSIKLYKTFQNVSSSYPLASLHICFAFILWKTKNSKVIRSVIPSEGSCRLCASAQAIKSIDTCEKHTKFAIWFHSVYFEIAGQNWPLSFVLIEILVTAPDCQICRMVYFQNELIGVYRWPYYKIQWWSYINSDFLR